MDAIKKLPTPLRYGIPVVLVLGIGLVLWMTMFRSPPPQVVITTQDIGVYEAAQKVLDGRNIEYTTETQGDSFSIMIPTDLITKASEALAASGIKDNTGLAKSIKCPAPPGFTATKAANERSANCDDAKKVQGMLLAAGAIAANVTVSQETTSEFLGPEKAKNVVVQVFLPREMEGTWNAEQAAQAIRAAVGTTIDRVLISDEQLQCMSGCTSAAAESSSGEAVSTSGSAACDSIATATEIETKKDAVRGCYEWRISAKLTELLGGSDRYVLTVEPTILGVSTQVKKIENSPGPVEDMSTQSGGGSSAEDISNVPNSTETTQVIPAGAISSLRITATLDKTVVTADQELAVKRMLSTFVDPKRRDPAPVVTLSKFANGNAAPTEQDLKDIRDAASGTQAGAGANLPGKTTTTNELPAWALAVMAVLVIGIITAVLVLWRRSTAMDAERQRLEDSFRSEQRLFEDFAQQNPDQLAQDLNALFGAPAAAEPTYR